MSASRSSQSKLQAEHFEGQSAQHPSQKWAPAHGGEGDIARTLFDDPEDLEEDISPDAQRKLQRKVDLMILPYLAVCYAFFYIDKTTLSYAAIFGIQDDLQLVGTQYSWLSSLFYFGFLFWAFPTNYMMQRFPIAKYLGVNIFLWGFFLILQAACNTFAELAVLRILGGAAEACSDPSFMLITSMWYTRRQQPVRIGIWYTANGIGIAGGGLLGYGIGHIRGALPSWKYEFIVIGSLCCIWGIVLFLFLPDTPVTARLLTKQERRWAVKRLRDDQTGIENKQFKPYQLKEAFLDVKLYLFFLLALVSNVPNGGISNFSTLILKGMGYETLITTILQIPYGVFISISILVCVFVNDRIAKQGWNSRCYFVVIFMLPNIAGAFGLRYVPEDQRVGRLICYYLTGPYNAAFVLILSLQTANTAGHTKKVVTNACLFLGYCVGNIIGPFFYKTDQAPLYQLGIGSMIFSHLAEIVLILVLRFVLAKENKRREMEQGDVSAEELQVQRDASAFSDLTDRENAHFRYIY